MSLRASMSSLVLGALIAFVTFSSVVKATALTFNLPAGEKSCYYIENDKPGKKVGFYFAVCLV